MKTLSFLEENINDEKINDIYNRQIIVDNIYSFIKENDKKWGVKI